MAADRIDSFSLEPEPKPESSYGINSLHRIPAQFIKGATTKLAGEAGDIPGFFHDLMINPAVKAFGGKDVPYEESHIGKIFPTTFQHQKNIEEGIPYFKPKNRTEKFANDLGQDVMSLFLPTRYMRIAGRLAGAVPSFVKSSGVALGSGLLGEGVRAWSGDEQKGAMAKTGSMFLFNLFNPGGARQIERDLYQESRRLLPQGAQVNTNRLVTDLTRQRNDILGNRAIQDLSTNERFVVDEIDKVLRNSQHGISDVADILRMRTSVHDSLESHVWNAPPGETRKAIRRRATGVSRALNETLGDYGRTNPQWWGAQRSADQAHGAIQGSNFISKIVQDHFSSGQISPALMHMLTGSAVASGAAIPYMAVKVGYQILRSPQLRNHYMNVIRNAVQGNMPVVKKEIEYLNNEVKKMEEKETFTLED